METTDDIGDRLDQLMQAHPLYRDRGQNALARKTGVPQPTINRILGKKSVPEMATVAKLAIEFDVTCEWLLTGRGPKFVAELGSTDQSANVLRRGIPEYRGQQELPENVKNALQSMLHAFRIGNDIRSADLRIISRYALTPVESGKIATRFEPVPADTETAMHDFVQQAREKAAEGASGPRASHAKRPATSGKRKSRQP